MTNKTAGSAAQLGATLRANKVSSPDKTGGQQPLSARKVEKKTSLLTKVVKTSTISPSKPL